MSDQPLRPPGAAPNPMHQLQTTMQLYPQLNRFQPYHAGFRPSSSRSGPSRTSRPTVQYLPRAAVMEQIASQQKSLYAILHSQLRSHSQNPAMPRLQTSGFLPYNGLLNPGIEAQMIGQNMQRQQHQAGLQNPPHMPRMPTESGLPRMPTEPGFLPYVPYLDFERQANGQNQQPQRCVQDLQAEIPNGQEDLEQAANKELDKAFSQIPMPPQQTMTLDEIKEYFTQQMKTRRLKIEEELGEINNEIQLLQPLEMFMDNASIPSGQNLQQQEEPEQILAQQQPAEPTQIQKEQAAMLQKLQRNAFQCVQPKKGELKKATKSSLKNQLERNVPQAAQNDVLPVQNPQKQVAEKLQTMESSQQKKTKSSLKNQLARVRAGKDDWERNVPQAAQNDVLPVQNPQKQVAEKLQTTESSQQKKTKSSLKNQLARVRAEKEDWLERNVPQAAQNDVLPVQNPQKQVAEKLQTTESSQQKKTNSSLKKLVQPQESHRLETNVPQLSRNDDLLRQQERVQIRQKQDVEERQPMKSPQQQKTNSSLKNPVQPPESHRLETNVPRLSRNDGLPLHQESVQNLQKQDVEERRPMKSPQQQKTVRHHIEANIPQPSQTNVLPLGHEVVQNLQKAVVEELQTKKSLQQKKTMSPLKNQMNTERIVSQPTSNDGPHEEGRQIPTNPVVPAMEHQKNDDVTPTNKNNKEEEDLEKTKQSKMKNLERLMAKIKGVEADPEQNQQKEAQMQPEQPAEETAPTKKRIKRMIKVPKKPKMQQTLENAADPQQPAEIKVEETSKNPMQTPKIPLEQFNVRYLTVPKKPKMSAEVQTEVQKQVAADQMVQPMEQVQPREAMVHKGDTSGATAEAQQPKNIKRKFEEVPELAPAAADDATFNEKMLPFKKRRTVRRKAAMKAEQPAHEATPIYDVIRFEEHDCLKIKLKRRSTDSSENSPSKGASLGGEPMMAEPMVLQEAAQDHNDMAEVVSQLPAENEDHADEHVTEESDVADATEPGSDSPFKHGVIAFHKFASAYDVDVNFLKETFRTSPACFKSSAGIIPSFDADAIVCFIDIQDGKVEDDITPYIPGDMELFYVIVDNESRKITALQRRLSETRENRPSQMYEYIQNFILHHAD